MWVRFPAEAVLSLTPCGPVTGNVLTMTLPPTVNETLQWPALIAAHLTMYYCGGDSVVLGIVYPSPPSLLQSRGITVSAGSSLRRQVTNVFTECVWDGGGSGGPEFIFYFFIFSYRFLVMLF